MKSAKELRQGFVLRWFGHERDNNQRYNEEHAGDADNMADDLSQLLEFIHNFSSWSAGYVAFA